MRIIISLLFLFSFSNSFSQSDSVANRFTIGITPFLFASPQQDGLFFGYRLNEEMSFFIGGGIYNLIKTPLADEDAVNGFSIRSSVRFDWECGKMGHKENNHFYELIFFYRRMKYSSRSYEKCATSVFEANYPFFCPGEDYVDYAGNEVKSVFCLQALFGKRYLFVQNENFAFDFFYGFGLRIKYREISVTRDNINSPSIFETLNPPREELIINLLPSIHSGVKFAYTF